MAIRVRASTPATVGLPGRSACRPGGRIAVPIAGIGTPAVFAAAPDRVARKRARSPRNTRGDDLLRRLVSRRFASYRCLPRPGDLDNGHAARCRGHSPPRHARRGGLGRPPPSAHRPDGARRGGSAAVGRLAERRRARRTAGWCPATSSLTRACTCAGSIIGRYGSDFGPVVSRFAPARCAMLESSKKSGGITLLLLIPRLVLALGGSRDTTCGTSLPTRH
jgi:hypothetical protein